MSNRRELKRNISHLLGDVIEECYNAMLDNDGKNEKEVEKLVDGIVDVADKLISKTNASKKLKSRAEVKKHFASIKEELGEKVMGYIKKVDAL